MAIGPTTKRHAELAEASLPLVSHAVQMLRQAQHDVLRFRNSFSGFLGIHAIG
jgi:hypothetical protein